MEPGPQFRAFVPSDAPPAFHGEAAGFLGGTSRPNARVRVVQARKHPKVTSPDAQLAGMAKLAPHGANPSTPLGRALRARMN